MYKYIFTEDTQQRRDIVLSTKQGPLRHIHETHPLYDPLQYVLFFPYGSPGWHPNIRNLNNGRKITALQYYSYHIIKRKNKLTQQIIFNSLHHGGRLFQQWVVDQYAKIDQSRLEFFRSHQKQIRAEQYCGLVDAIQSDDFVNAGKRVILPASYYGGPRNMHQKYQDAMAIVRDKGKPDLFITITCNPKWIEIQRELYPGQTASDRPDLVARIFRLKIQVF